MTDSALEKGKQALLDIKAQGTKVSMNLVAKRGGFSHTLFSKKTHAWQDFRSDVEQAVKEWKTEQEKADITSLQSEIHLLKKQLKYAKKNIKELNNNSNQKSFDILFVKMTELYRMNDKLQAENSELKSLIKYSNNNRNEVIRENSDTGEVINAIFNGKPDS